MGSRGATIMYSTWTQNCVTELLSWFKNVFYVVENNVCMVYPIRCALFIKLWLKVQIENKIDK